jgi:hypothetical protein
MRYVYLDDSNIEIGGTNFTSLAILEDRIEDVEIIKCSELKVHTIDSNKDSFWILGNITGLFSLDSNVITHLVESIKDFVKIEFDYNYCQYRGEIPHQVLGGEVCKCPAVPVVDYLYSWVITTSKHMFFMSERQRAIYSTHFPTFKFHCSSVLSSCFTRGNLQLFRNVRRQESEKNDRYAILKGFGGWHSKAKGLEESIKYCIENNLPYDVLPIQQYEQHIGTLSKYKGLIFLPIIDDTCPRCVIEAKLLDLQVVTSLNSQHVTEWWWDQEKEEVEKYVSDRPKYFWAKIDEL